MDPMRPSAPSRPAPRRRDDRGEVAANTVVFVAVIALFFLVVEAGVMFAAHQVARGAARQALDAARLADGSAAEGEALAEEWLEQTNIIQNADVTVVRNDETVTVTVTGDAWSPRPVGVSVTMSAPVERVAE